MIFSVRVVCVLLFVVKYGQSFVGNVFSRRNMQSSSTSKLGLAVGEVDTNTLLTWALTGSVAFLGVSTFVGYAKSQFMIANLIGGMPPQSEVVELDAVDGKNIFYLPKGCSYTAVMKLNNIMDAKKRKDKMAMNEQLVLECVGKANRDGLGLSGKMRTNIAEIPSKSTDCVLSIGAIQRISNGNLGAQKQLLSEVYRVLRPGGLFVFYEPNQTEGGFTKYLAELFPRELKGAMSASDKLKQSKRIAANKQLIAADSAGEGMAKRSRSLKNRLEDEMKILDSNVNSFASEPLEVVKEEVKSEAQSESTGESGTPSVEENQVSDKKKAIIRPGITMEEVALLPWAKVVTGIAIKP